MKPVNPFAPNVGDIALQRQREREARHDGNPFVNGVEVEPTKGNVAKPQGHESNDETTTGTSLDMSSAPKLPTESTLEEQLALTVDSWQAMLTGASHVDSLAMLRTACELVEMSARQALHESTTIGELGAATKMLRDTYTVSNSLYKIGRTRLWGLTESRVGEKFDGGGFTFYFTKPQPYREKFDKAGLMEDYPKIYELYTTRVENSDSVGTLRFGK